MRANSQSLKTSPLHQSSTPQVNVSSIQHIVRSAPVQQIACPTFANETGTQYLTTIPVQPVLATAFSSSGTVHSPITVVKNTYSLFK